MKMNYVDKVEGGHDSNFHIEQWLEKGMSWENYISQSQENVDRMRKLYQELTISEPHVAYFRGKGPFTIVCISEDWCPDCAQNVPLIARLSESLPMTELKMYFRDRNKELMDHYETDGRRVVPTVIFLDRDLNELGRWAGPSRKAKTWTIETLIKGRKIDEIPQEERERFGRLYDTRFLQEFINDSLEEMKVAISK